MDNKIIYNKIYDGIVEIKNFLSVDECKNIVKIIESLSENCWQDAKHKNWDKRNLKLDIKNKDLDIIKNKISIKVKNIFDSYLLIDPPNNSVHIQRILPATGGLNAHKDNFVQTTIKYGLVLYYNDDYEGGEIEYPEINIVHKPSTGSLLIHEGKHLHQVNEVFKKTRYMSTFFIHENENTKALLKELSYE
jgi:hypothetical protein